VQRIKIILGDITKLNVDAIVNAANTSLLGGGGVDGAIHAAGGPTIFAACEKIATAQGGCPVGQSVITTAGELPATFVIHTVGPKWAGGLKNEDLKLANCYTSALELAVQNNCQTIAFPSISTGVYRYPTEEAAIVAINSIKKFLVTNNTIQEIILVSFDQENYSILQKIYTEIV
jgi:O-acetyl-ADP-ribose deacetylase